MRRNLGYTRRIALMLDLNHCLPNLDFCTSTYCLANKNQQYVCFFPAGGSEGLDLTGLDGEFQVEWFNPATGVSVETSFDVALLAADQLSGLITAAALVRPDKDLAGVKLKSVRKRYREGAFARGVDRTAIARSSDLGLELDEVMAIGLEAMQGIAPDLGL